MLLSIICLLLEIPIQLGGLKGQEIIYHSYDNVDNKCYMYSYYGVDDGLYQFKNGKKIVFIPIDKGYIEYSYSIKYKKTL